MGDHPLVSVVVIFLNARKYLTEAIDSVLAQTYHRWELILVDDGSTDGSSEIAHSYVERVPGRIQYIDHPGHRNLGMSASRNLGMQRANGELIAMLDADDVWVPRKLEEQVGILMANKEVSMVYGRTLLWSSWRNQPESGKKDAIAPFHLKLERSYGPPQLLVNILRRHIPPPSMSSVCFWRGLVDRTRGFEEAFPGMYEDQVFVAKVFLSETVYCSSQVWDNYRIHPESSSALSEQKGLSVSARETFLMWLEQYVRDQGHGEISAGRAVRWALWDLRHPAVAKTFYSLRNLPDKGRRAFAMISALTQRAKNQAIA